MKNCPQSWQPLPRELLISLDNVENVAFVACTDLLVGVFALRAGAGAGLAAFLNNVGLEIA